MTIIDYLLTLSGIIYFEVCKGVVAVIVGSTKNIAKLLGKIAKWDLATRARGQALRNARNAAEQGCSERNECSKLSKKSVRFVTDPARRSAGHVMAAAKIEWLSSVWRGYHPFDSAPHSIVGQQSS